MSIGEGRVDLERKRELPRRLIKLLLLRQDCSQFVVHLFVGGVKLRGTLQFSGGRVRIATKAKDSPQRAVGLRIARTEFHGLLCLGKRSVKISLLNVRRGKIDSSLYQLRLQFDSLANVL